MIHIHEVVRILEQAGLATEGVDIFINTMPHDVNPCIQLKTPTNGADIDEEQEGFTKHYFTIIVRDDDADRGWNKARALGEALRIDYYEEPGVKIRKMYPLELPASYHFGESDQVEVSLRMRCWFQLTS